MCSILALGKRALSAHPPVAIEGAAYRFAWAEPTEVKITRVPRNRRIRSRVRRGGARHHVAGQGHPGSPPVSPSSRTNVIIDVGGKRVAGILVYGDARGSGSFEPGKENRAGCGGTKWRLSPNELPPLGFRAPLQQAAAPVVGR
jgi:hypothetical protein